MGRQDICLVVPESLKNSKETCYKGKDNVITFRSFFRDEMAAKRPGLKGTKPVVVVDDSPQPADLFSSDLSRELPS